MFWEGIFTFKRLSRLVRSGDSQRFGLELEKDGETIVGQIATNAAARLISMSAFVTAKVKKKDCVAYNAYPENLVLRAIANYIARRFKVITSSRDRIVRGVTEALYDRTPIYVIRRDLSSFYETIPLEPVRSRLLYDTAISRTIRHYLKEFYDTHCAGKTHGLPRGIGLTTILVELAMEPFDRDIRAIPGVYRYFRYSDDMLIFAFKDQAGVAKKIDDAIANLPGMKFNASKSDMKSFDGEMNPLDAKKQPIPAPSTASFDFLGYSFKAEQRVRRDKPRVVWLSIAEKKVKLIKTRIFLSLKAFEENGDSQALVDRLCVLSGNYRINRRGVHAIRRSRFIYAGIYYNYWRCGEYRNGNHVPTTPDCLSDIDNFMHGFLSGKASPFGAKIAATLTPAQKARLKRLSFARGFEGKRMVRIPFNRFSKLKAIWRNA
ncbi:antiviral reverse transcriptase Drt3a [Sphingomonas azotifigens]|uniref:antiviral reverse transcriptase Drt3a n=1 Tax=Sphingomonas azotifigens TaxID=330920 RepID=UPI001C3F848D|nr:antiviral reverse transcriptase Drt3a [Sphingomonas azotifigens]